MMTDEKQALSIWTLNRYTNPKFFIPPLFAGFDSKAEHVKRKEKSNRKIEE